MSYCEAVEMPPAAEEPSACPSAEAATPARVLPRTTRKRHTRTQSRSRVYARSLSRAPSESKDDASSVASTSSLVKRFFSASWRAADAAAAAAYAAEMLEQRQASRRSSRSEASEAKECHAACCRAAPCLDAGDSVSTVSSLDHGDGDEEDWEPSHCVYIVGPRDAESDVAEGGYHEAFAEVLETMPHEAAASRPASAASMASSEARPASPVTSAAPSVRLCEICYSRSIEPDWSFCGECDFAVCMTCSVRHVETQVARAGRASCLDWRCSAEIPDEKLEAMLSPDQMAKLQRLRDRRSAEKHECPSCNEFGAHDPESRRFGCESCHEASCKNCKRPWGRLDCRAHLCSPEPADFALWRFGRNVRHCPRCRNVIEKNGGCPHMTCVWCGFEFMWCCKQPYHKHDADYCLPLRVVKNRNPLFGPTKPVRAVTKGVALVAGGAALVVAGTAYGALYLAPVEGARFVARTARRAAHRS